MFENPRRGKQARNFTTNAPKILDLKSSSEQIFSRKLPLGAPDKGTLIDDSVWPEENDLRRRFLNDEGAAFTLFFRFENRRARERSQVTMLTS